MDQPSVVVLGTGSYLPGKPVGVDQVDAVLGRIDGLTEKLDGRIDKFRQRLLARSGVTTRYFAIDPESRRQTETHASMAEMAARSALDAASMAPEDVDLLVFSSSAFDQGTPPTSATIQDRLGIAECAEFSIHSNCTGVPKSIQLATDMLRQGRYRHALLTYAQLSSLYLRSEFYNPAKVGLENITLRWMLSDGAGALLLSCDDHGRRCPEIVDAYVECVGTGRPAGMTMNLGAASGPELAHRPTPYLVSICEEGYHHLWQDVGAVARDAPGMVVEGLGRMLHAIGVSPREISRLLLPIPGRHFMNEKLLDPLTELIGPSDERRFPFVVADFGYCGGAASLVQFDRMNRKGQFEPGELIAVYVEESSKWMSGGFVVRCV